MLKRSFFQKGFGMRFIVLVLLLFHIASFVQALNPISIKGNKFFDSKTKKQFFIKG